MGMMNPYGQMPYMPAGQAPAGGGGSLFGGAALPPGGASPGGVATPPPGGGADPNMAALANLTPEQIKYILSVQGGKFNLPPELMRHTAQTSQQGLETGNLDRQQQLADSLRSGGMDMGKGTQAGRRFVAPTAAQTIVGGLQGAMGGYQTGDIAQRRKAMVGEGQQGVDALLKSLMGGG